MGCGCKKKSEQNKTQNVSTPNKPSTTPNKVIIKESPKNHEDNHQSELINKIIRKLKEERKI